MRDDLQLKAIQAAAVLHDTGKIAVPEAILNKPGPLDKDEFAIMKQHAAVGADIISSINFPYPVEPMSHITMKTGTARLPNRTRRNRDSNWRPNPRRFDCFDALTSDRPYRGRMSDAEALKIIVDRRGRSTILWSSTPFWRCLPIEIR